jgi:hypothetical protein
MAHGQTTPGGFDDLRAMQTSEHRKSGSDRLNLTPGDDVNPSFDAKKQHFPSRLVRRLTPGNPDVKLSPRGLTGPSRELLAGFQWFKRLSSWLIGDPEVIAFFRRSVGVPWTLPSNGDF